jgi:hypothetical protein
LMRKRYSRDSPSSLNRAAHSRPGHGPRFQSTPLDKELACSTDRGFTEVRGVKPPGCGCCGLLRLVARKLVLAKAELREFVACECVPRVCVPRVCVPRVSVPGEQMCRERTLAGCKTPHTPPGLTQPGCANHPPQMVPWLGEYRPPFQCLSRSSMLTAVDSWCDSFHPGVA